MSTRDKVYQYIAQYIRHHGFSPTYREIAEACDLRDPSAARYHALALVQQGRLRRVQYRHRGLKLP